MLSPDQVIPFLQHDDPLVRKHAEHYFRDSHDFGSLTAEHFWAVIDRFGETDQTLGVAAALSGVPQTDASLARLLKALEAGATEDFEFHYQHAARDMQFDILARHSDELLGCSKLLSHVRKHLELRLSLRDQPPAEMWNRLMEHGRELIHARASGFDKGQSDALIEASARGGPAICELAMATLADESAAEDWREIFAVRVLGQARYEPAIDALIEKFAIDADVLREEVQRALVRIGTPRVVERCLSFYPGKPWHVRLYASDPLSHIKHPDSEAGLLKMIEIEHEMDAHPDEADDEAQSLVDQRLYDLTELCSLAGLEESRRMIPEDPTDSELLGLTEALLATSIMCGVSLPEETVWRDRLSNRDRRAANQIGAANALFKTIRDNWMRDGVSFPPSGLDDDDDEDFADKEISFDSMPPTQHLLANQPLAPIRNTSPKVGRNDPCPCGSGKKFKKCCGKK